MSGTILLKDMRIITPTSESKGDILIKDGIIAEIGDSISSSADKVIDGKGKLCVSPGLFDMHVHFRDPGLTHKEDIITGTDAAAAGGITGVVTMPNTKPATDTVETVKYIIEKAEGSGVTIYPSACITKGLLGQELCDYESLKKAGATVITDDGRPVQNPDMLFKALQLSKENGLLVACHCEDLDIIDGGIINKGKISEELGVKGMDRLSEDSITERDILLCEKADARIHICHVSTKGSAEIIRNAKKRGVRVTCETCPHYFIYTDEKLLAKDADYRMNPPLREEEDRQAIIEAILDGTIDCIVTDHAPHAAEEKADFLKAPNGVVGLETSLAATLTALYHTGKVSLSKIVSLMSENPRRIAGAEVAEIKVGSKADMTIFDPDEEWVVVPSELKSKSKNTVFKGEKFKGKAKAIINGNIIKSNI
ncbi:MAG: dihydroorotase [Oscillospiraceae bacterium]|nr:dihydroorotase [Oscillospiraceae bacterium]